MADRSVSVELRLKAASYLAGMSAAKKATRDLAQETLKATKENHRNLEQVGRAGLVAGGTIAAGLALAVRASANFDKSLSGVKAVANATEGEMQALRKAALDAGAATVFSASQAADAEAELAKAGVSVKDIMGGGLRGSLDLAAAGQLDLADAATISAQAMNIFKLRGSDVTHIADVLAAGANKSAADVKQLGDALRQGGLVASQTGVGLEETVGALSAFADNALIGSDAGTSFKTMLQRLLPQSKEAGDAMESIGFNAFDAQGNFVGLAEVAGQLQQGLGKLTAEQRAATLASIFGADAVRAANVLYEEGEAGIRDYTAAVNDNGAAQRMAATQLDNLSGDLEQLRGSFETALIKQGSAGNDSLRSLTQTATSAVNAFSSLPEPVQKASFFMAALSSGTLLTIGAMGTLVPKVRAGRESLRGLGEAGVRADRGLSRVGRAAGRAAGALAAGVIAYEAARKVLGADTDSDFAAIAANVEAGAGDGTQAKIAALTRKIKELDDASVDGLLNFRAWGYNVALGSMDAYDAANAADSLRDRLKQLKAEQKNATLEAKNSVTAQRDLADAYQNTVAPAVEDATDALDAYVAQLEDTAAIDAYTAAAELANSFKDLSKEIKTAGEVTNDEKVALGGFARDVRSTAQAVLDQTGSQHKANQAMRDGRKQFIDLAEQAGYSADQAKKLADRLLGIPSRTDVKVDASEIDDALAKTRHLVNLLARLGVDRSVGLGIANKTKAQGYASGGLIPGPPSRSDTVPAMLSTGEFVVNAAATSANRALLEAINSGSVQRFADGGVVRSAPYAGVGAGISLTNHIVAPDPVGAGVAVSRQVRNDLWAAGWMPS